MLKHNIINLLGKTFNFTSFLEISHVSSRHTYDRVDESLLSIKSAIYYMNAHKYEYHHNKTSNENIKYDIVLVDPWNTYEQSYHDIVMALTFVSPNGIIIVHGCCPCSQDSVGSYKKEFWHKKEVWDKKNFWCGQTYEAFIDFRYKHQDLETFCIFSDYGCGIISMLPRFSINSLFEDFDRNKLAEWDYFNLNKMKLLDLIEPEEFVDRLHHQKIDL
ncbi:MAG: hypothetical protein MUO21_01875 [Nitrososphaeraceae archaeon]|nr:hypothetical protein [Nitrososphaeraceae archaeon]